MSSPVIMQQIFLWFIRPQVVLLPFNPFTKLKLLFSGKLLKTRRSLDGEWLALEERNVEFKNSRVLFLTQPVDYVHVIDKDSPLYELSKGVLQGDEPLELIVIMAGTF